MHPDLREGTLEPRNVELHWKENLRREGGRKKECCCRNGRRRPLRAFGFCETAPLPTTQPEAKLRCVCVFAGERGAWARC